MIGLGSDKKVCLGILSRRFENLVKKVKILPALLLQFCFLINLGCKSSKFCIISPIIWRKSLKFCRRHFCNFSYWRNKKWVVEFCQGGSRIWWKRLKSCRRYFCKGWGLSAKLGKHSAIWGKLGTALQAYTLNPCTKFPPNPTSRKVNT